MPEHNPKILKRIQEGNSTFYTLQNGTKLGEVFNELPAGIINKTVTGIGATTLELESKRNSIIVEPLKITASTKAEKHQSLYVGSETKFHSKVTKDNISKYLADDSTTYKKIVVVADSFPRVIEALGDSVYQDYFLMIDEVDSFQNDSTFRDSMERCLDYYKRFPTDKRALVSATHIGYSDPDLQNEARVVINYQEPIPRKIKLIHTDNVAGTAFEQLQEVIKRHPNQKIVVAYNYVNGCYELANQLVHAKVVKASDIKILCSYNSKTKVGSFYATLNNDNLPTKINFLTSAYYTGVDINERYHLISLSNAEVPVTTLSDHRLKQVAGRCRPGLLSERIIYSTKETTEKEANTTIDDLIKAAKVEIKSLDCFKSHFSKNPVLNRSLTKIRDLVINSTQHFGFSLVRLDYKQEAAVSYFNIDASIEMLRINQEIYNNPDSLKTLLEDNNKVSFEKVRSKTLIQEHTKIATEEHNALIEKALLNLEELNDNEPIYVLLTQNDLSSIERQLYSEFDSLREYVDREQLLEKLREFFQDKPDVRGWNRFKQSAIFAAMEESHLLRRHLNHYFSKGELYTSEEIKNNLELALRDSVIPYKISSTTSAVKLLGIILSITRSTRGKKRGYVIGAPNPNGVRIKKQISDKATSIQDLLNRVT